MSTQIGELELELEQVKSELAKLRKVHENFKSTLYKRMDGDSWQRFYICSQCGFINEDHAETASPMVSEEPEALRDQTCLEETSCFLRNNVPKDQIRSNGTNCFTRGKARMDPDYKIEPKKPKLLTDEWWGREDPSFW